MLSTTTLVGVGTTCSKIAWECIKVVWPKIVLEIQKANWLVEDRKAQAKIQCHLDSQQKNVAFIGLRGATKTAMDKEGESEDLSLRKVHFTAPVGNTPSMALWNIPGCEHNLKAIDTYFFDHKLMAYDVLMLVLSDNYIDFAYRVAKRALEKKVHIHFLLCEKDDFVGSQGEAILNHVNSKLKTRFPKRDPIKSSTLKIQDFKDALKNNEAPTSILAENPSSVLHTSHGEIPTPPSPSPAPTQDQEHSETLYPQLHNIVEEPPSYIQMPSYKNSIPLPNSPIPSHVPNNPLPNYAPPKNALPRPPSLANQVIPNYPLPSNPQANHPPENAVPNQYPQYDNFPRPYAPPDNALPHHPPLDNHIVPNHPLPKNPFANAPPSHSPYPDNARPDQYHAEDFPSPHPNYPPPNDALAYQQFANHDNHAVPNHRLPNPLPNALHNSFPEYAHYPERDNFPSHNSPVPNFAVPQGDFHMGPSSARYFEDGPTSPNHTPPLGYHNPSHAPLPVNYSPPPLTPPAQPPPGFVPLYHQPVMLQHSNSVPNIVYSPPPPPLPHMYSQQQLIYFI